MLLLPQPIYETTSNFTPALLSALKRFPNSSLLWFGFLATALIADAALLAQLNWDLEMPKACKGEEGSGQERTLAAGLNPSGTRASPATNYGPAAGQSNSTQLPQHIQKLPSNLADRVAAYPLQKSYSGQTAKWLSQRWSSARLVDAGRSRKDPQGVYRRVALVGPSDLPYTIRIEELVYEAADGTETILFTSEVVANHAIVRFHPGTDLERVAAELETVAKLTAISRNLNLYRVVAKETTLDGVLDHIKSLSARPDWVKYAEVDSINNSWGGSGFSQARLSVIKAARDTGV